MNAYFRKFLPVCRTLTESLKAYWKLRVFNTAMTTRDMYRPRLNAMIDLKHSLALLLGHSP
jgi:hypothetical protein